MNVAKRLGLMAVGVLICGSVANASVLLNDTWADGDRTSVGLPYNSPTYIGQSAGNGANSVSPGSLNFIAATNSMKIWTYFTEDGTAPDGNQPHNSVPQLAVGDKMIQTVGFKLPLGATVAVDTGKDVRFGMFFDPTDARVQVDTNSDGGGGTSPWQDATGYAVQFPLNGNTSGGSPIQLVKRTTNNTSLLGASGALTNAPTGGTAYAIAAATDYTASITLDVVSASQLDITFKLMQGATTLASQTVSDTGTAFGGTAIAGGLLPGSQSIYTKFDHFFVRISDNSQYITANGNPGDTVNLQFTNFQIEHVIPEPGSLSLLAIGGLMGLRRSRRRH